MAAVWSTIVAGVRTRIHNQMEVVRYKNNFSLALLILLKPFHASLRQAHLQRLPWVGLPFHQNLAAGGAKGSTMVVLFVRRMIWLM